MKRRDDELQYDYCARRLNDQILTRAHLRGMTFLFKPGQSAQRQVPKRVKGKLAKKAFKKARRRMINALYNQEVNV